MISFDRFGLTSGGKEVIRYIMQNRSGMSVSVLTYGCTVQSIIVPDRYGAPVDVALGYDDLSSYEQGICFYGAVVGRYANRIKNAEFTLNGTCYHLEKNFGEHHHHGCFSRRIFDGEICSDTLILRYRSAHMEEGFPGNLDVEVRYRLTEDNALEIEYLAGTDQDTVLNLTNHTYFNLNGNGSSDVLSHTLRLDSCGITEADSSSVPTGRILDISGTPFDFRSEKALGRDILADHEQLRQCGGYDHNYILNVKDGELRDFALLKSDKSGISLSCATTQPAVQLYTGNLLEEDPVPHGKGGVRYPIHGGVCLETQHYPASPAFPHFPTTVLKKGETYFQKTVYRFGTC